MRRAIVIVVAVWAFAATAFAQSKHELARAHYKSGAAYYQRGKYVDAIREFEQSYELSRKPDILYNLAQCHDKLGQRDKVVGYLRRYLKDKPKADDREQVEAWLGNLEKALAADRAAADRAAADRAAAEKAAADRAAADRATADRATAAARAAADKAAADKAAADKRAATAHAAADKATAEKTAAEKTAAEARAAADKAAAEKTAAPRAADTVALAKARREAKEAGSTWRTLGDVGVGLGIVTVICSAIPAALAYTKARNLEDKLGQDQPNPVFTPGLQSDYRNGPGLDRLFIGLAVTGGVVLVAGIVALVYGKKLQRRATEKLYLTPGAAGADLAWRF
jgi:tetratricopeptide (TPR) repeat protein